MKYNLLALNTLVPAEFEYIREKGAEYRRSLSDPVLTQLTVPPGWCINAEYRAEFGGMFPVQCRLSAIDRDEFHVCVCSPGELSPYWLVVLLSGDGCTVSTLQQSEQFDPQGVNALVSKIAGMKRFNCSAATVITLLAREVAA
jgi:hypothetical protein